MRKKIESQNESQSTISNPDLFGNLIGELSKNGFESSVVNGVVYVTADNIEDTAKKISIIVKEIKFRGSWGVKHK